MPTDLLLPAFALTLALNAAIVAVAIRALRDEGARRERAAARGSVPPSDGRRPTVSPPQAPETGSRPIVTSPNGAADPPAPPATTASREAAAEAMPAAPGAAAVDRAPDPVLVPVPARAAARPGGSARRRKFSLPPLDDDHEKVSRSIRTFLAGADAASGPPIEGAPGVSTSSPTPPAPIVTVAAIQIVGDGPRDILERTVRSSARATDEVTVDRRGRVRIVLAGTGELAARAYLRRIRATIEPIVEAADPTSRIVTATATELDGAIATARRRADRRLALAVRGAGPPADQAQDEPDDEAIEPRAAGD